MFPFQDKQQIVINSTTKNILDTFNINPEIHNRTSNLLFIYLYVTLQDTAQPDICEKILKYLKGKLLLTNIDINLLSLFEIDNFFLISLITFSI